MFDITEQDRIFMREAIQLEIIQYTTETASCQIRAGAHMK